MTILEKIEQVVTVAKGRLAETNEAPKALWASEQVFQVLANAGYSQEFQGLSVALKKNLEKGSLRVIGVRGSAIHKAIKQG